MSTGFKMAASAVVGAAVTAALFLAHSSGPDLSPPPPAAPAAGAPVIPSPATGAGAVPGGATAQVPAPPVDLAALPVIRGDGEVRGRVATKEGEGVEGVVVVATPGPDRSAWRNDSGPPDLDLEEEIARAAAAAHRRVTGTRRATTGPDGKYVIEGLGDAGYSLIAYAPGHSVRPARGHNANDARPGAVVDFVAKPIVQVRIVVEGLDEANSARVTVHRAADEESLKHAGGSWWSPDSPVLTMEPGRWWLMAAQGDDRERVSEPVEVVLEAGAPERTVVLVLHGRPGLRGAIVVGDELAVQRADVYALRFEGDEPPALDPLGRTRGAIRGRCDLRDMRYSVRDIGPGRWFVWVTLDSARPMGSFVVDISDRMVERDLEVGIDDPERYVVVRAIGPDGEPLPARGTNFSCSFKGPGGVGVCPAEAIRRTDGSWLVAPDPRMPQHSDDAGWTWRIKVTHRGLGSREVPCDPKTQRELEFRFGEASSLTVTVSGLEESALAGSAGLHLKTHLEPTGMSFSGSPVRPSGGVFVLDEVQPGEWILVLVADSVQVDRIPITVRAGRNEIRWPLPPLHTVRLEAADKKVAVRFGLKRLDPGGDWTHQYASATAGAVAVFRYVPPGRYELTGTYQGEKRSIPIDVPAQTHVLLE